MRSGPPPPAAAAAAAAASATAAAAGEAAPWPLSIDTAPDGPTCRLDFAPSATRKQQYRSGKGAGSNSKSRVCMQAARQLAELRRCCAAGALSGTWKRLAGLRAGLMIGGDVHCHVLL